MYSYSQTGLLGVYEGSLVSQILKESACDPSVRMILWRWEWQPTPVFLPGESHGQRSLMGYSPWGSKELNITEQLTHTHTFIYFLKFSKKSLECLLLYANTYNSST